MADAAYTTVNAAADLNPDNEFNNIDPLNNVWFKFVATKKQIDATVDIGCAKGTRSRTQLALLQADGTTEIQSDTYFPVSRSVDVNVQAVDFVVGQTYYISVATYTHNAEGTFMVCLKDAVDYDFYEAVIDVTGLINNCSPNAEFYMEVRIIRAIFINLIFQIEQEHSFLLGKVPLMLMEPIVLPRQLLLMPIYPLQKRTMPTIMWRVQQQPIPL